MAKPCPVVVVGRWAQGRKANKDVAKLSNSNTNKGENKEYDYVAGCLIAYACEIAFNNGYDGFVSLKPKERARNKL